MKKVLLSILAFMFFTLSANAAGVGVVNYDEISKNYSVAKRYNADLNNRVNAIKNLTKQKQKAVDEAKTNAEKTKLKKEALAQIEAKQKEYVQIRDRYEIELTKKINAAVETVRVQKKLDVVINSGAVITGGVNITKDVLAILK